MHDDETISKIIHEANIGDLIKDNGLDFIIKENGSNLSAGQKQLIQFCRAALRHNKIILMDEATANIDLQTEETL